MVERMKYALCLSGLVGGTKGHGGAGDYIDYEYCAKTYRQHVIRPNRCDVFLHSWSIDLASSLIETYQPKSCSFESQIDFDGKHPKYRMRSKWHSMRRAVKLMLDQGSYDFVMVGRYDMVVLRDFVFSKLQSEKLYVTCQTHFQSKNTPRYIKPNHGESKKQKKKWLNDIYFIGSAKTLSKFLFDPPVDWLESTSNNVHKATYRRATNTLGQDNIDYYGWRDIDWDLYRWRICRSKK